MPNAKPIKDPRITVPRKLFDKLEVYAELGTLSAAHHAAEAIEDYICRDAKGYLKKNNPIAKIGTDKTTLPALDPPPEQREWGDTFNCKPAAYVEEVYDPCDPNNQHYDPAECEERKKRQTSMADWLKMTSETDDDDGEEAN